MSRADFIEETTTSIAGTAGNGAITLTQITGLPRFSQAFGTSTRLVDYVIEDTVNLKFEKGYGSIASNVLTRTQVHETWDGTTYTQVNATALAFGSTPTSGNIRIRCAPTADVFVPVSPSTALDSANNLIATGYAFSGHYSGRGNPSSGGNLVANTEYYVPFLHLGRGKIDGFGLVIGTAAGTGIKAALYEVGTDGYPGPCITQFNAVSSATTGTKTDTAFGTWGVNAGPLRLAPSWLYFGLISDGAPAIWRFTQGSQYGGTPLIRYDGYGATGTIYSNGQSYATGMPTGTPGRTYSSTSVAVGLELPLLSLKVANA